MPPAGGGQGQNHRSQAGADTPVHRQTARQEMTPGSAFTSYPLPPAASVQTVFPAIYACYPHPPFICLRIQFLEESVARIFLPSVPYRFPAFDHLAVLNDKNLIHIADAGQTMCDHDDRLIFHKLCKGFLQFMLVFRIYGSAWPRP